MAGHEIADVWATVLCGATGGATRQFGNVVTGGNTVVGNAQANLLAKGHGFAEPFTWRDHHRIEPSAMHPPPPRAAPSPASRRAFSWRGWPLRWCPWSFPCQPGSE